MGEGLSGDDSAMMEPVMLTKAEARAVEALFQYSSMSLAAVKLGIGYETLRTQMLTVRRKFGVKTNLELVALAFKRGGFLY